MTENVSYSDRLRLRACTLITENDKLLLVKQRVPTRSHPIWLPPGGEVAFGETTKEAAFRETKEETGLQIAISHLAAVHEFIEMPYHAVEFFFIAERKGGELITGIDPEHTDENQQIITSEFISFLDLEKIDLFPEFLKNRWREMLASQMEFIHVGLK